MVVVVAWWWFTEPIQNNLSLYFSICRRYDEIADRLGEMPSTTAEIVALSNFLRESCEVTVFKLKDEIDEAASRLMFLLDYANLPCM